LTKLKARPARQSKRKKKSLFYSSIFHLHFKRMNLAEFCFSILLIVFAAPSHAQQRGCSISLEELKQTAKLVEAPKGRGNTVTFDVQVKDYYKRWGLARVKLRKGKVYTITQHEDYPYDVYIYSKNGTLVTKVYGNAGTLKGYTFQFVPPARGYYYLSFHLPSCFRLSTYKFSVSLRTFSCREDMPTCRTRRGYGPNSCMSFCNEVPLVDGSFRATYTHTLMQIEMRANQTYKIKPAYMPSDGPPNYHRIVHTDFATGTHHAFNYGAGEKTGSNYYFKPPMDGAYILSFGASREDIEAGEFSFELKLPK